MGELTVPPIWAIDVRQRQNRIRQLLVPPESLEVRVTEFAEGRVRGFLLEPTQTEREPILAILNTAKPPAGYAHAVRLSPAFEGERELPVSVPKARWVAHPHLSSVPSEPFAFEALLQDVANSWTGAFAYQQENRETGSAGLRPPQLGALHAALAHWAVTDEPATIVMPTGTGKTETMLSILVAADVPKLLVVVPTDALRRQAFDKFLTLGVLKSAGVLSRTAKYPVVGYLKQKPRNVQEVDELFERCNVVVSTINVVGQCTEAVQERIIWHCTHLFIDEAHHVPAATWSALKKGFGSKRIVQFTATPFRDDGRLVDGTVIFNYPLRKAQEEGYFTPIRFRPVAEFSPKLADRAIAEAAVAQLRQDREKYDHVLMARAGSVKRAEEIFSLYEQYEDLNPVQLHTGITSLKDRQSIQDKITSGEAKIVVCVDMFGEGFDLPQLKIAAFHDIRKSLPVTLQIAGRFTRSQANLGEATFIANIADVQVDEELRSLYAQDADWNALLRDTSTGMIQEQIDFQDFLRGFENLPRHIPLRNVRPAMSTVAYRTTCDDWEPGKFRDGLPGAEGFDQIYHDVHDAEKTLVIVTAQRVPVKWAGSDNVFDLAWNLYVVFWDRSQKLLFINSSSNSGHYQDLAKAIAGEGATLISGPTIFRTFANVNRLSLQNVGLLEQLAQFIRFTMRSGPDIGAGLTQAQRQNVIKANVFGVGYENGARVSVGCSYKGRIWSRRTANLMTLTRWCSSVGAKLLNEEIHPDTVLEGTLIPTSVGERPDKMPIAISWPDAIWEHPESIFEFDLGDGNRVPLYETDLVLDDPSEHDELRFRVESRFARARFRLELAGTGENASFQVVQLDAQQPKLHNRRAGTDLAAFFGQHPPTVWFADGSSLVGTQYTQLNYEIDPYPVGEIQEWDWEGVDIRKESQGTAPDADSIQYRVIEHLRADDYAVVFDDDGSGEAADVVAIKFEDDVINVKFYHCKYSREASPGARIADLYEVCGQAQKSVAWMDRVRKADLFAHLLRREPKHKDGEERTRFEVGDADILTEFHGMSRLRRLSLEIAIVQPGVSKANVSEAQLHLLGVTENYLMETYSVPLTVITSP